MTRTRTRTDNYCDAAAASRQRSIALVVRVAIKCVDALHEAVPNLEAKQLEVVAQMVSVCRCDNGHDSFLHSQSQMENRTCTSAHCSAWPATDLKAPTKYHLRLLLFCFHRALHDGWVHHRCATDQDLHGDCAHTPRYAEL